MNSKYKNYITFIIGAVVGSMVTRRYLKSKYEQIARDEIESVKSTFARREADTETSVNDSETKKTDIMAYDSVLHGSGYTNYSDSSAKDNDAGEPYVITPEEFGDDVEYEKIGLIFYADKILADDDGNLITDAESTIGNGYLNCFESGDDDSVYIRNDILMLDYEILRDNRKYADVFKRKPHEVD